MAIDINNPESTAMLRRAVQYAWEHGACERTRRRDLIDIYKGRESNTYLENIETAETMVNRFQEFVKGQLLTLAYRVPRWAVTTRTMQGRGFDKRIKNFLTRYSEILELKRLQHQWAVDSCFGYTIAKIVSGPAPKGVHSGVAPRVYRISPQLMIYDRSAFHVEEADFLGDIYLMPLNEALEEPSFDPEVRATLSAWTQLDDADVLPNDVSAYDALAELHCRLVDIYLPTRGEIVTWQCNSVHFSEIGSQPPLRVKKTSINPYEIMVPILVPDTLEELASLESLRELHILENQMWWKGAQQARASQRNPITEVGEEQDLANLLSSADNDPLCLNNKAALDFYQIPGPDPSIVQMAQLAGGMFGMLAGNLPVRLGQSAGADTARQTQALLGQLSAAAALDRDRFDNFLANIGKKLATLAFEDEALSIDVIESVPGTTLVFNRGWAPPETLPRIGTIDDYFFEVVPYSTGYRTPQERMTQLDAASRGVLQWMMAKAQGAPVNLQVVMDEYANAFDQVPSLADFWSGEEPPVADQAVTTYQSLSSPDSGGGGGGPGSGPQGGGAAPPIEQGEGGMSAPTEGE